MENAEHHKGLYKSYITGFIISVVLTLCAYIPVQIHVSSRHESIPHETILLLIIPLAFVQMIVQLVFFLHLGRETKPRWKLVVFVSFISIILIVVIASLWIIQHLNYNMGPTQLDNFMKHGEGF